MSVSLTGETRHDFGNQPVQLLVLGLLDLERVLTDIVQRLVLRASPSACSR